MANLPPPLPPAQQRSGSPPPLPEQEFEDNGQTPIHPGVLAAALIAIAILLLLLIWLLLTAGGKLLQLASNSPSGGPQESSVGSEEVIMGIEAEVETSNSSDTDKPATANKPSDQTDASPTADPDTAPTNVDDESSQAKLDETAEESLPDGATKTSRTRVINTGSGDRLSANGVNPFMVGTEAKSTVFVIDKSSSMSGRAFQSVRNSLLQAVEFLNQSQRFSVVFFDSAAHPMPPKHMIQADSNGKNTATRFIEQMSPAGGTNPYTATRMALDMNPESIVVLSDGEFDITEVIRITEENQRNRKIPIHCIGLQSHITTLEKLAEDNSGTYRTANTPP